MTIISNYHTHTTFCDGKASPKTMIDEAIKLGIKHLGFSAHSIYPFSDSWHLPVANFVKYIEEIRQLKEQYKDVIEIFCGFEADYFPPNSMPQYSLYQEFEPDYLIGSVHFLYDYSHPEKGYFEVDGSARNIATGLRNVFDNNGKKAVQTYFAAERAMMESCDCDIIGHIDLIRIRNGLLHFFSESEPWYIRELEATAKIAAKSGMIVEVNTGGVARGLIDTPYPSLEFLKILNKYNVPITINSDAHSPELLTSYFSEACELAKEAGYSEIVYITKDGLKNRLL